MYYGMFLLNSAGELAVRHFPPMHLVLAVLYYTVRLFLPDTRSVWISLLHQFSTGTAFLFSAAALCGREPGASRFVRMGVFTMLLSDSFILEYTPTLYIVPACLFTPLAVAQLPEFRSRQWHVVAVVVQLAWSALHIAVHVMFWRTLDRSGSKLASVWSWIGGSLVVCKLVAHALAGLYERIAVVDK